MLLCSQCAHLEGYGAAEGEGLQAAQSQCGTLTVSLQHDSISVCRTGGRGGGIRVAREGLSTRPLLHIRPAEGMVSVL